MTKWKYVRVVLLCLAVFGMAYLVAYGAERSFDFRERARAPVAVEIVGLTIDYGTNATTATATVTKNGSVEQIIFTMPHLNAAGSNATFRLKDENDVIIYQTPDTGQNSTFFSSSQLVFRPNHHPIEGYRHILILGTTTVEVEMDTAQTEDVAITVDLYMR